MASAFCASFKKSGQRKTERRGTVEPARRETVVEKAAAEQMGEEATWILERAQVHPTSCATRVSPTGGLRRAFVPSEIVDTGDQGQTKVEVDHQALNDGTTLLARHLGLFALFRRSFVKNSARFDAAAITSKWSKKTKARAREKTTWPLKCAPARTSIITVG